LCPPCYETLLRSPLMRRCSIFSLVGGLALSYLGIVTLRTLAD
jgi:hypothetical protein